MDYSSQPDILKAFRAAQDADTDMREAAREAGYFVNKRDGQWEPEIIHRLRGKPRYTDDRTNPIINQIVGEIDNSDFSVKVRPAGGDASKDSAKLYDGLIRNIRNISNFDQTQSQASRIQVECGLAGWEIVQDYADTDSFDQDLLIQPIHDYVDRVWFDPSDFSRDKRDANWCVILDYVDKDQYKKRWPEGSMNGLSTDNESEVYYHKKDFIMVGRLYYREEVKKTLFLMNNGAVYEDNEDFEMARDELEAAGIYVEDERERNTYEVKMRYFDASDWLADAEETVFSSIPVIPIYANYKVQEGKILYRGAVEKLMDQQRVHNYAFSRNVEEIALKPRNKIFMTDKQIAGYEEEVRTMNTNMNPVQRWNPDSEAPPPFYVDTSAVNMSVANLVESTDQGISRSAGMFAANMGDNPGLQSGVAIGQQIDKGNNGVGPYFEAMRCAIVRTGEILVNAIPKVYDATRQVRLLGEDGAYEMSILNQVVLDAQTGEPVTLNDLTVGNYDVTVDIGAKYKNRQQETAEQFAMIAQRDPSIMALAADVYFKNMNAPGFDLVAERARAQMLNNAVIPVEQMTDEERQAYEQEQAEAANQPPPVDPAAMQLAQAETMKAEADMMEAQNKQAQLQIDAQKLQLEAAKIQMANQANIEKTQSETAVNIAKVEQDQQKIDLQAQQQQIDTMLAMQKQQVEMQKGLAETLEKIRSAMGADAIMSPETVQAYNNVSKGLNDASE